MLFLIMLLCGCEDVCPTIREYHDAGIDANCLLCQVFDIISNTSLRCAEGAWKHLAKPLRNVAVLAGAIYIAVNTFKLVSSFGKQTVADYMTGDKRGLLLYMFKLAVIVLLLSESTEDSLIINDVMVPILQAGIEIGGKLSLSHFMENIDISGMGRGWACLFDLINEAVEQFSNAIYETIAIGEAMVCNATLNSFFGWYYLMLLYGFILFIFGWVILIGVSFYIVDILIRLTFAAILLPLGIACAVSKLTLGYTKNIWNLFINVFFSFLMLGIILGIAIQMVLLSMGRTSDISFASPALNAFLTNLDMQIDANAIKSLSQDLWSNGDLLLTIICFSITVQLLEQMGKLAGDISDTGDFASISPGSEVGAALAKKPIQAGKKVAGFVGDTAVDGVKYAGHVTARVTRADKLYHWSGRQAQAMRGFLTGTGAQGYNAMWHKQTWRKIGQDANRRFLIAKPYISALWNKIKR
ncbi:MAG: hypothetical protein J6C85_06095 [Alphaproteobacteria bacterium]|nr:hypothetical protein [Alphaproteobacteria bacterium]